ncbi:MAG: MATE family efflux transporter [Ruminococcus bromii]|nr:MATE family efflux transporter [Ruminococcus bromii]MEE3499010.1 MATE family efflux transporter [Ruminococcus bromii]
MEDAAKNFEQINIMGIADVKKLTLTMGLPMIISMALQAVYNIVDSYFVSCMPSTDGISNLSDLAVNALTLAFPVQMLMVAIGVGTGVGINAILSRSLGEGDREKAGKIAGNSIFLGLCMFVLFLLFGFFGVNAYIKKSQTSDPVIIEMGVSYLRICTVGSLGVSMYMTYEKLLQATGKTMQSTIAQISGAITNIILDPIMIFGLCGCPQMGIEGAAYATVIGQFVSFILDAIFHHKYNSKEFSTSLKYIKPELTIIGQIYRVGVPAIIMQALMSFMTYGVNVIFALVSTEAVTAYGIYYKIQQFVFFAAFGMNNAMIPIIAFNYGRRNKKRINDGIKYGMIYTLIIMLAGAVLLQVLANPILSVFTLSDKTRELCLIAVRIVTLGYLFVGANIAFQGIFQALGNGVSSLVLSIVRLIAVPLPLAYALTFVSNAESLIWISFPIGELCAFAVSLILMKRIRKQKIAPLKS